MFWCFYCFEHISHAGFPRIFYIFHLFPLLTLKCRLGRFHKNLNRWCNKLLKFFQKQKSRKRCNIYTKAFTNKRNNDDSRENEMLYDVKLEVEELFMVNKGLDFLYILHNQIICQKFEIEICQLREHQQKTFVMLGRFWPLKGWGGLGKSVKKRKVCDKNLFSDIIE